MILIAYDGSPDAKAAIARAGELMNGQATTVLTVWEPFVDVMTRTGAGLTLMPDMVDFAQLDAASEASARQSAEEGAGLAEDAGLSARPRILARRARSPTRSCPGPRKRARRPSPWARAG